MVIDSHVVSVLVILHGVRGNYQLVITRMMVNIGRTVKVYFPGIDSDDVSVPDLTDNRNESTTRHP